MVNNFIAYNPFETVNSTVTDYSREQALLVQQKLLTTVHLFTFFIGFVLWEWGQARRKNAELAVAKHLLLLISSSLITFLFGYAIAYGEPHLMGTKYFLSLKMLKSDSTLANPEILALNYLTMMLSMAITSSVTVSSINERQSLVW